MSYLETIFFLFYILALVSSWSLILKKQGDKNASPKIVLALEYKKSPEVQEEAHSPSPAEPEPEPEPAKVEAPVAEPPDLLVILVSLSLILKILGIYSPLTNLWIFPIFHTWIHGQ